MALGGLLTALTFIILYLTLLIPTNTLTLFTLASFMVPIALIRSNLKTAILVYVCSSLLSVIILPIHISLMYIIFFGCYGLIKSLIEKLDKLPLEWILKLVYFNVVFIICFNMIQILLDPNFFDTLKNLAKQFIPNIPNGYFILLWLFGQVTFVVFDYALTLLIDMYFKYFDSM